jgi:isocitrate lyase
MYPDQSLYPANAAPELCRRINRTLRRADEIEASEGKVTATGTSPSSPTPRPGFGGPLNSFEIMKAFIEAGAAGVHFEDQLAPRRSAATSGGKV